MSSFMVSDRHISFLVDAHFALHGHLPITASDSQGIGEVLAAENIKAIRYRYGADAQDMLPSAPYCYRWSRVAHFDPVAVIKAAQCYHYQCSEHADFDKSKAAAFVKNLIGAAIASLPGYHVAPWAIEETFP